MGLNYLHLITEVRAHMVAEIDADAAAGRTYLSSYLSERGRADWVQLLREAAQTGVDESFGAMLQRSGRINETAQRRKPKGGYSTVRVPVTAHETMSEGEFNRFYIRGLCLYAIERGIEAVEVYRAKQAENPRPESEQKIGERYPPQQLLEDLRQNVGLETSTGFPGPNSGLSVKLPD